jgi:hypothetical protein
LLICKQKTKNLLNPKLQHEAYHPVQLNGLLVADVDEACLDAEGRNENTNIYNKRRDRMRIKKRMHDACRL